MERRITQADIGSKLGLTKATVSLALRGDSRISAGTRARVEAMAREMGYRPDPALATLARQRWAGHETGSGATLAYLVDSRMENHGQHRRFLAAAQERAEMRGYRLNEIDLAKFPGMEAVGRVLIARGIRGVLVPQFAHQERLEVLELPREKLTFMSLDEGWDPYPFHMVTTDYFEGTRMVWREVARRGYRRIGGAVMEHQPRALDDVTRLAASLVSQMEWVRDEEQIPLLTADTKDRESFLRWYRRHRPEVVIGMIPRLYFWLVEAGVRVPEETAFAALLAPERQPEEVAGTRVMARETGEAGVDALIAAMNQHEWGIPTQQRKLMLTPVWNEGTTLPWRTGKEGGSGRRAGKVRRGSPLPARGAHAGVNGQPGPPGGESG